MNDKMLAYLMKQFEALDEELTIAELSVMTTNLPMLKRLMQISSYVRYIKHGIFESENCEHCIESGLIEE